MSPEKVQQLRELVERYSAGALCMGVDKGTLVDLQAERIRELELAESGAKESLALERIDRIALEASRHGSSAELALELIRWEFDRISGVGDGLGRLNWQEVQSNNSSEPEA